MSSWLEVLLGTVVGPFLGHGIGRYAHAVVVSDQARAGLDILTTGDYHLDEVEVGIPTCWGNPDMQEVLTDAFYANSIDIHLHRLRGDVWTIEAAEKDFKESPLFMAHKGSLQKKIAVGVPSHRTLQADFPDVIAAPVSRCLDCIPADNLILSADFGFGRQGFNRPLALDKTAGDPMARTIILKELGLPERYIPAADQRPAWDQLPDEEMHTHLKPLHRWPEPPWN